MRSADRFSDRIENYVKYRPGYPVQMIDLFRREMGLAEGTVVADIGCGPGMSSEPFLKAGCVVYGVEPNAGMLAAAEDAFADFPGFHPVKGSAQSTGLPDSSIDIAVAAQAFHWFNEPAVAEEFRRIAKPGGFAALIWNERWLDATPFLEGYEELLLEFGTDYKSVRHDNLSEGDLAATFGTQFRSASFPNRQDLDLEGVTGRLRSSSYTPGEGHEDFGPMLARLRDLFARYEENGKIQLLYDTNVFYTQLQ